jgi:hypothetical protein
LNKEYKGTTCPNDRIDYSVTSISPDTVMIFDGCTWNYVTPSTEGNGGGIYLSGNDNTKQSISIIHSSFIHINIDYYSSGAFYVYRIACVNISSSSFESLSAYDCGVGSIASIGKCVLFHNCNCDDCNAYYCGGLYLGSYSPSSESDCVNYSSRGCIFGCLFSHCKAKDSYCSGLYLSSTSSSFSLRSSIFKLWKPKTKWRRNIHDLHEFRCC